MNRQTWESRLIDAVIRFRKTVLVATFLLSVLAAFYLPRLAFESDIEIWFLDDDASLIRYRKFVEQFQSDEIEVIGVFADDVFTPQLLSAIEGITKESAKAPFVHKVYSLTNIQIVSSRAAYYAYIGPLMEKLPTDRQTAKALRKRALDNVLVRDNLVSRDGRATAIVVELDPNINSVEHKVEIVRKLREIVKRHLPDSIPWYLSGSPTLDDAVFRYSERDLTVLGPVAFLLILLSCLYLFGYSWVSVTPLVVVTLASLWLLGLMGALGIKINLISSSLMVLILAVGVADGIHVVSDYLRELAAGLPRDRAIAHSAAGLVVPCFFTSATTAAGFLALMTSQLGLIAQFGWLAAVGVAFAFILSITFLPAVLRLMPEPKSGIKGRWRSHSIAGLLAVLGRPTQRSSWYVIVISGFLLLAAAFSLPFLRIGANPMNYFRDDDPVRRSIYKVEQALGGSGSFDLLVRTKAGGLKEPAILRRLDACASDLESLPAVTQVLSILDMLKETRRVLTDGRPESALLPDTRSMAAQLYMMLEGEPEFNRYIKGDYEITRMSARVSFSEASKLTKHMDDIKKKLQIRYNDDDLQIQATGFLVLTAEMEGYLLNSQISSFLAAFFVVTIMILALLGSVRLAFFSMIPNLIPIVLGLSFMVWFDIALDPGTVMVGCMALGLVVDDTVHFMVRLRRNLQTLDLQNAIARSIAQTGRPIILTSLVLAAGFFTLILSRFTPNMTFGLISAIVVLLAMVADLVLLPATLMIFSTKTSGSADR